MHRNLRDRIQAWRTYWHAYTGDQEPLSERDAVLDDMEAAIADVDAMECDLAEANQRLKDDGMDMVGDPQRWPATVSPPDYAGLAEPADELVRRFLTWPLPESVCADLCVTKSGFSHDIFPPRSGTNLLTADEARQMLAYVLGGRTA